MIVLLITRGYSFQLTSGKFSHVTGSYGFHSSACCRFEHITRANDHWIGEVVRAMRSKLPGSSEKTLRKWLKKIFAGGPYNDFKACLGQLEKANGGRSLNTKTRAMIVQMMQAGCFSFEGLPPSRFAAHFSPDELRFKPHLKRGGHKPTLASSDAAPLPNPEPLSADNTEPSTAATEATTSPTEASGTAASAPSTAPTIGIAVSNENLRPLLYVIAFFMTHAPPYDSSVGRDDFLANTILPNYENTRQPFHFLPAPFTRRAPSPLAYATLMCTLRLHDPTLWPDSGHLRCPTCGYDLVPVGEADKRSSWSDDFRRILDGTGLTHFMVSRKLICKGEGKGRNGTSAATKFHRISSFDDDVVKQLGPCGQEVTRRCFGLRKRKVTYAPPLLDRIFDVSASAVSVNHFAQETQLVQGSHEDSIGIMLAGHQLKYKADRLRQTTLSSWVISNPPSASSTLSATASTSTAAVGSSTERIEIQPIASMGPLDGSLSAQVLKDVADTVVAPIVPELMVSLVITIAWILAQLAMDHTFQSVKKQSEDLYAACLTMRANATGAIMAWMTESTANVDVTDMLQLIVSINRPLQLSKLQKVLGKLSTSATRLDGFTSDEQFALSYLEHYCLVRIYKAAGHQMVQKLRFTQAELEEISSVPLETLYLDNCCHLRNAVHSACPELLLQLPPVERATRVRMIDPLCTKGYSISPMVPPSDDQPEASPLFSLRPTTFSRSLDIEMAGAISKLMALLTSNCICFDLEWEAGSSTGVTAIILAGVARSAGMREDVTIAVNVFGATAATFESEPTLKTIKSFFASPNCQKYGFSIGNDRTRLEQLGFVLRQVTDLAAHQQVKGLGSKKRSLASRAQAVFRQWHEMGVVESVLAVSKGSESTTFASQRFSPAQWRYCHYDGFLTHVVAAFVDNRLKLDFDSLQRRRAVLATKYNLDQSAWTASPNSDTSADDDDHADDHEPNVQATDGQVATHVDLSAGVKGDIFHAVGSMP